MTGWTSGAPNPGGGGAPKPGGGAAYGCADVLAKALGAAAAARGGAWPGRVGAETNGLDAAAAPGAAMTGAGCTSWTVRGRLAPGPLRATSILGCVMVPSFGLGVEGRPSWSDDWAERTGRLRGLKPYEAWMISLVPLGDTVANSVTANSRTATWPSDDEAHSCVPSRDHDRSRTSRSNRSAKTANGSEMSVNHSEMVPWAHRARSEHVLAIFAGWLGSRMKRSGQ